MRKLKLFTLLAGFLFSVGMVKADSSVYIHEGNCGPNDADNLTYRYDEQTQELVISGSGAMKDFTSMITPPWCMYTHKPKYITLPVGLTHIGTYAFRNCIESSIIIPSTVTSIGDNAFQMNGSLTSITLPNGLEALGNSVFWACTVLEELVIPAAVNSIGYGLTDQCTALTNIEVAAGNTVYDSRNNCKAIIKKADNSLIAGCKSTVIPNTVRIIAQQAFSNQTKITSMAIPEGVEKIEDKAFGGCSKLETINIPSTVNNIHYRAFRNNYNMTSIRVAAGNTTYDSRNDCNAIIETATNTLFRGCQNTVIRMV